MILILCAFRAEFTPLHARLQAVKDARLQPVKGCYGTLAGVPVLLAESGIGMRRARATARRIFDNVREIDFAVLTGVAGALSPRLKIGDLVLADRVMTRADDGFRPEITLDVPSDYFDRAAAALTRREIRYVRGAILTSKLPIATAAEKRLAGAQSGAVAVDMETAAIALEAQERGHPYIAMRAIMDTVDHDLAAARFANADGTVQYGKAAAALLTHPAMVFGVIRLIRNLRRAADAMATAVTRSAPYLD
jgi:adenosylhomocysteine nucleosidase